MPRPVAPSQRYLPGLDGVRALAVLVVVAYHLGLDRFQGGLLGVGIFFTLSGYLITALLLEAWDRSGHLELRTFWIRRARRLLPALVLVLVVVLLVTALTDPSQMTQRWREALGALFFVGNWQTIAEGASYFDRFSGPRPFDHLWSLAVEEQFYLIWPLLLTVLLRFGAGDRRRVVRPVLALAAASFVLLSINAGTGFDHTRAYEGTDTRAGGLLVGAAVALWWRPGSIPPMTRRQRAGLDLLGVVSLVVLALLVQRTDPYSTSLYHGGLLLLSVATSATVAVAATPGSWLGRALGVAPLRWVGERSYGIYLWHLPVIVFVPATLMPRHPVATGVVQVALILGLAAVSWRWVENPVRRHGFRALLRRPLPVREPGQPATPRLHLGLALCTAVAVPTLAVTTWLDRADVPDRSLAGILMADLPVTSPGADASGGSGGGRLTSGEPRPSDRSSGGQDARAGSSSGTPHSRPRKAAGGTSCTAVAHIGDSTSLGLVRPAYQPDRQLRVPAQYHRVGAEQVVTDVDGARSIVEKYRGRPNAAEAVAAQVDSGFEGCWVLALGINEVANQQVGGVWSYDERIDRVMQELGGAPALWTTVRTRLSSGPYAEAHMDDWGAALIRACGRYPRLRVFDWAAVVQPEWYGPDGIHYTPAGYAQRARLLAAAVAEAFPADGTPSPCVVGQPS